MPHVLIERARDFPEFVKSVGSARKHSDVAAYLAETVDIVSGLLFLLGSVYFLPVYAEHVGTFYYACDLFIVGSFGFCVVCAFTLAEAMIEIGPVSMEALENGLYLSGSWLFLMGSIVYRPDNQKLGIDLSMLNAGGPPIFTLELYCRHGGNLDGEMLGCILFIVGSTMFACAAFLNALNPRKSEEELSRLLSATTCLYFAGSLFCVMGSVAMLPHMGCEESMAWIGAWSFIGASLLFTIGSCLSLLRTVRLRRSPESESLTGRRDL